MRAGTFSPYINDVNVATDCTQHGTLAVRLYGASNWSTLTMFAAPAFTA